MSTTHIPWQGEQKFEYRMTVISLGVRIETIDAEGKIIDAKIMAGDKSGKLTEYTKYSTAVAEAGHLRKILA